MPQSRAYTPPSLKVAITAALFVSAAVFAGDAKADPWADGARRFMPGGFAGFGAADLPDIVLGPPEGSGDREGSFHVVSLGHGGSIEVVFRDNAVVDGPGDDLVVFENAFRVSGGATVFDERAWVEVSVNGRDFFRFPHDAESGLGLAGLTPVLANSSNQFDPLDPLSGGDRFDLADLGLDHIRYVRLIDGGDELPDFGNLAFPGSKGGFDLDAVAGIHSVATVQLRGVVVRNDTPVSGVRIVAREEQGGRKRLRRTDANGRFVIRRLFPGGQLRVKARGRELGRAKATLDLANAQPRVELTMELD